MVENNVYSAPESDLGVQEGDMLASRWARLGGTIVDAIAVMAIAGPVMYFSGFWDRAMSGSVSTLETIAYGLLGMAIYLILNGYFLAKHGQTVGKKVVGTRIVSNETNEIIPLWKVFFVRYLPMAIGGEYSCDRAAYSYP